MWLFMEGVEKREPSKGAVFVEPLYDPAGGGHPHTVGVEQYLHHHPWMVGRVTPLLLVVVHDRRKVHLVHHVGDEAGQVVRG